MLAEPLYPLRFEPILKEIIWGGQRLGTVLGKTLGSGTNYAESWEISDHRLDVSQVADGPLAGVGLRDLIRTRGEDLLGASFAARAQFPLLIKFLDAHQVLSVQVHPDDERGKVLANDMGKTEAWVVIHAEPGSLIYSGLRSGVTQSQFADALASGDVEPLLHRFEAQPGDCVFIPAGTVHAIGSGILLAEVQQMSDATFRIHDWGRLGADNKPRTLHLDESMKSIDFAAGPVDPLIPKLDASAAGTRERLIHCPYFALERLRLEGPTTVGDPRRFTILIGLGGDAEVRCGGHAYPISLGHTLLLPAALGEVSLVPKGEAVILTCVVP